MALEVLSGELLAVVEIIAPLQIFMEIVNASIFVRFAKSRGFDDEVLGKVMNALSSISLIEEWLIEGNHAIGEGG